MSGRLTYNTEGERRGYVIDIMGIQAENLTKASTVANNVDGHTLFTREW